MSILSSSSQQTHGCRPPPTSAARHRQIPLVVCCGPQESNEDHRTVAKTPDHKQACQRAIGEVPSKSLAESGPVAVVEMRTLNPWTCERTKG